MKEDDAELFDELVVGGGDAKAEVIVGLVRIVINNVIIANKIGNLLDRRFENIYDILAQNYMYIEIDSVKLGYYFFMVIISKQLK